MDSEKTIKPSFPDDLDLDSVNLNQTIVPPRDLPPRPVFNPPEKPSASFLILKKGSIETIDVDPAENIFRIGKAEKNEITIDDQSISDIQVALVKLGDYIYFMDCGTKDIVSFNGVRRRQAIGEAKDRMIMKIGNTMVIYLGSSAEKIRQNAIKKAATSTFQKPEGEFLLKSDKAEWFSDSAPVLVGKHQACDLVLDGPEIHDFHCLFYFNERGLFVEDLTQGKPGIKINDINSIGARPIKEDATILFGKTKVFLYVYDNLIERANVLFYNFNPKPNLAFTNLLSNNDPVVLPRTNERLSIGRGSQCNIIVHDPSISRHHAEIAIREKCLLISDKKSHNKTYVNLKPIEKGTILPGDIVEFGDTPFLLHYE